MPPEREGAGGLVGRLRVMVDELENADDDVPEFEDVSADLDIAGQLLVALAQGDDATVNALRASDDADWWNVALTLAILLRDLHSGQSSAVKMIDFLLGGESRPTVD
jgi:hypothetical protein